MEDSCMDVTPINTLLGDFASAGRSIAPALAGLGFLVSALQFLLAHVIGSSRGQEIGKGGMVGSVVGLIAVFVAPQIMDAIHGAFGS
jgi:type IV secretion system pilin